LGDDSANTQLFCHLDSKEEVQVTNHDLIRKEDGSNELKVDPLNHHSCIVPKLAISLSEAEERMKALNDFVTQMMQEGVDYGRLEGYSKPTLLKPGAEKLCDAFGFSKQVDVIQRIEEWEKGFFAYEVKVTLINKQTGMMDAEGIGSCNSREKSFAHQDPYTLVNTFLKMAKKRALIDAVLSATRASGIFTQDIEDFAGTQIKQNNEPATPKQREMIYRLVAEMNMHPNTAKELMMQMYQVDHSTKLTKQQASSFIQDLLLLKSEH
jgi:hypothetical protein